MNQNQPVPPLAHKKPEKLTIHGDTRTDNYYWLREKDSPEVLAYLAAENQYTEVMTAHTQDLQAQLYQEMVDRIQETDSTVPVRRGEYFYYTRTVTGRQYQFHCRKKGSLEADEEVVIDENELATGQPYFKLGIYEISPDHKIAAYSSDTSGSENYTIFFKNLETGEILPDRIENTSYSAAWANDNATFFYTVKDDTFRDFQLLRHTLGTSGKDDALLFQEDDALFEVHISKSKDKAYIFLTVESIESTEEHYLPADQPLAKFRCFQTRRPRIQYSISHHLGNFYILSNEDAPNFKLLQTPVEAQQSSWTELLPHDANHYLDSMELFDRHMIIYGRENGLRTVRIYDFDTGTITPLSFPEPVYSYLRAQNPEARAPSFRLIYQSLTTADTVYDINMETQAWVFKKQLPVLGGYDPQNYLTERIFATAADGARIPISIVYKKGTDLDGQAPCLLYGYGSYGANIEPRFDAKRLSLLDRGFIFAIAHIRGSKTMGRSWYDQGKWLHKRNTFTDFIACAKHLNSENYTNSEKLAIHGRSAGGLLMGAAVTMAPELFKACVAGVPFVDVVTTMLDETIPLTVGEFEEWGNPKDPDYYTYMLSYSPYDNTTAQSYPHILITAGLNDPRVQYWEPAKWTARLRDVKKDNHILLLKTFMGAGHFSSSGRYEYLKDVAFEFAFLLDILGQP